MSFIEGTRLGGGAEVRVSSPVATRWSGIALALSALAASGLGTACGSEARAVRGAQAPVEARIAAVVSRGSAADDLARCELVVRRAEAEATRAGWPAKQVAFDATFAEEVAAFRELEPELRDVELTTGAVADRADALRDGFVRRCIDESGWSSSACWSGTFARDITLALAKIRLRQGDHLAAAIEAFTLASDPDMRSVEAKLSSIAGAPCGEDEAAPWCRGWRREIGEELIALVSSRSPGHGLAWMSHEDVLTMEVDDDHALVAFRADRVEVELRALGEALAALPQAGREPGGRRGTFRDKAMEVAAAATAPLRVPRADLGFHESAGDEAFLALVTTDGERRGRIVESWIDSGDLDEHGDPVLEYVMFRGLPVRHAEPGYP